MTGEYRHGTITQTFLATPHRERVLSRRSVAAAVGGLTLALLLLVLATRSRSRGCSRQATRSSMFERRAAARRAGGSSRPRDLGRARCWRRRDRAQPGRRDHRRPRLVPHRRAPRRPASRPACRRYLPGAALSAIFEGSRGSLLAGRRRRVSLGYAAAFCARRNDPHGPPRHHLTAYPAAMAAPVEADEELELQVESLAYGGNGVARLNGFVVFVRRGLPGDTRPRARDQGEARPRRGARDRGARRRGRSASRRRARTTRPAAAAASRISRTRRRSRRRTARCATRSAGSAGSPSRRSSRSSRRVDLPLPQQARVLVHADAGRPGARLPQGGPLGRGARDREVLADDRPRQRDPRTPCATGRARSGSTPTTRRTHTGYLRHLVVREGRNTGQALVQLVTAPGERFERDYFVETLRRFPEVRSIHWVDERLARRGDEPADASCSGARTRSRRSSSACASASARTRSCRRTREMAERLYELAREFAGADRRRDRVRPLLRHRHDRPRRWRRTR